MTAHGAVENGFLNGGHAESCPASIPGFPQYFGIDQKMTWNRVYNASSLRERLRGVADLHGAREVGMFPVELRPDPLVQIPVEARGRLHGFGARSIGGAAMLLASPAVNADWPTSSRSTRKTSSQAPGEAIGAEGSKGRIGSICWL